MTDRLYYTEPALTEFDGQVVGVESDGDRQRVELDRTAFYPTSGGQPHDTGRLGGARVVDVCELDAARIAHVVERPSGGTLEVGQTVSGTIDWPRRFDHMQQHSGQHTLSAVFDRRGGARTVGFHLGRSASTIDLDRELSAEEVADAEADANQIVWDDRLVAIKFVSAAEAASLLLRKEPVKSGPLRLIEIAGVDLSACGGTHVARTGTIGLIAVMATERVKGATRVSFLCGRRALEGFRSQRHLLAASAQLFSGATADLPAQIAKLQADGKVRQKAFRTLEDRLSGFEAEALAATAVAIGRWTAVVSTVAVSDAGGLKRLAAAVTARPGRVAVLVSSGSPKLAVVARSADVSLDARAPLRLLVQQFGGRGGGQPGLAQGGGLEGADAEVVGAARRALAELD